MREIFSFVFKIITDPLSLPISPFWEWLILLGVEGVAQVFAFRRVGELYHKGAFESRAAGSAAHWFLRLVAFILIWAVLYGLIVFVKWALAHLTLALVIVGAILVALVVSVLLIRRYNDNHRGEY